MNNRFIPGNGRIVRGTDGQSGFEQLLMALPARDRQEIESYGSGLTGGIAVGCLVVLSEESGHESHALWITLGNKESSTVETCS